MDYSRIVSHYTSDIWFVLPKNCPKFLPGAVQIETLGSRGYLLEQGKTFCHAGLREPEKEYELNGWLTRDVARLAFITSISPSGEAAVRVHFFSAPLVHMGEVAIGVSKDLSSKYRIEDIKKAVQLKIGSEEYFLMWPYKEGDDNESGFAIVGDSLTLPLSRSRDAGGEKLWLSKIATTTPEDGKGIRLVKGSIFMKDMGDIQNVREFVTTQLDRILTQQGSYLAAWDTYCALEGQTLLDEARKTGAIRYTSFNPVQGGFEFILEKDLSCPLESGISLAVETEMPPYLSNEAMTFEEYFQMQDEQFKALASEGNYRKKERCSGTARRFHSRSLELKMDSPNMYPPASGWLTLSLYGDLTRMQRKFQARASVRDATCANPQLGLIIEENGQMQPGGKREKVPALSQETENAIFAHPPTPAQMDAIDIALNTPDIAIIQGPPGTGKTTVIAAIVERINELLDPHTSSGAILVTSFQHDAVDNMMNKIKVNSLPTLKFGGRQGQSRSTSRAAIESWKKNFTEKLASEYPDLGIYGQLREVFSLCQTYVSNPVAENEKMLLESIRMLPAAYKSEEIDARTEKCLNAFKPTGMDWESMRRNVLSLRITPQAWADDGIYTSCRVLLELAQVLTEKESQLLEQTPESFPGGPEEFFPAMRDLQNNLLDRMMPDLQAQRPFPKTDIVELIGLLHKELKKTGNGDQKLKVVADFFYDLNGNPAELERALADCNTVYAATAQQAQGSEISAAKKRRKQDRENDGRKRAIIYDTVIIDEAARCSPMDMLIPMTQAAGRIILVGDEKQLPHIIDDAIARQMETESGKDMSDLLGQSMFKYLKDRCEKLTAQDKQPRFVMLDAQYRMHPLLGRLVSECFYDGKVRSPLGEENFQQNLPDIASIPAAWFDVPYRMGNCQRVSGSWQRECEAKEIVGRLKKWLPAPQGKGQSFGVITFYRAQKDKIVEIGLREGLLIRDSSGEAVLNPIYADDSVEEKLRINTVDAFQGKEFDIVLLSSVRCVAPGRLEQYENADVMGNACFGHLRFENRLCVALSRQKKFLGIVGSADILGTQAARDQLPSLAAFMNLCREKGKILQPMGDAQ